MSKKKSVRPQSKPRVAEAASPKRAKTEGFPWVWVLGLVGFTALLFSPVLGNSFTNWDDLFYVTENALLRGPDWKGIFSQPVVSNYHPLTILTLALNYQLSGLKPFSYYFINVLLHVVNAGLVFYLVWQLSERRRWVAVFVAAVFALHPMHVESVAWISERKDVLYTFFYLLGLLAYWRYVTEGSRSAYAWALVWVVLSLLSKPAAVAFPLTLLALDYWRGRSWKETKVWLEKLPFFVLALVMGIVTVQIQSQKAMASVEMYSLVHRLFFGSYTLVAYVLRFFWPWPLSPFHPYPPVNALGWDVQAAPLFLLLLAGAVWYFRSNRVLVFGALFYLANIILVAQFISIGNALLAERYTYVPYIGLAFALGMTIALYAPGRLKQALSWGTLGVAAVAFSALTFRYLDTWKDTESLWNTVLRYAPDAPVARSNRAHHYYQEALKPENAGRFEALMRKAVEDCEAALKANPKHYTSLDICALAHVRLGEVEQALPYAQRMVELAPENPKSHVMLGTVLQRLKRHDEAIAAFNQALTLDPNNPDALNGRGTALFNGKQQYREALADFDRAIAVQPNSGMVYLNRSRCYYMLGDKALARENAEKARALGTPVPEDYWQIIQ